MAVRLNPGFNRSCLAAYFRSCQTESSKFKLVYPNSLQAAWKIKRQKAKGKNQKAKVKAPISVELAIIAGSSFLPFAFCLLIYFPASAPAWRVLKLFLFSGACPDQEAEHCLVPGLTSHAQRSPPLAISPRALFNPDSGVDIRTTRHEQLNDLQMSFTARLNQRVLVPRYNLVDARTPVKKQLDYVRVSFTRRHDQRISVSGHRHVRISASVQ
jgi:hypothetical protein